MRDMFFLALLPLMLYAMAKRPFIALGMWIWTAMFFPNAWMYGMASGFRYNLIFTGITVLGYLCLREKPKLTFGAIGGFMLLFFFWTTLSSAFTMGMPELVWEIWVRFMKVTLLFVFVLMIIDKKIHIDFFLWCVVLSIGFYASVEGAKFVLSGGGHMIAGFVGHVLGDRNELALAFVITLPICYYLLGQLGPNTKLVRLFLLATMGALVTAIIGTQSRGGFVALLGLAAYLFVKSDRKITLAILAAALVGVLSFVVSDDWATRMDTIGDASGDASFMGRVVAWKLSFIMAMRSPLVGGGFKALEYFPVWSSLSQEFFSYTFFYTGDSLPDTTKAHAAHSVYFQVLGEHGFVGLGIFLTFVALSFKAARDVAKRAKAHVELYWISNLATMMQLSIFAFCLGGAALNFAYFELLYAICAIVQVLKSRILPAELAKLARLAASPPPATVELEKAAPAVGAAAALRR